MSKLIFIIIFIISINGCSNKKAKPNISSNKKIDIYYIHRNSCQACIYMDNILKSKEIKNLIDKKYNFKVIDYYKQDITNLPTTHKTPTFYFVKNGKIVYKIEKAMSKEDFIKKLSNNF